MKQIGLRFIQVMALAASVSTLPLRAADSKEVAWNQLCNATRGHELLLKTATGDMVEGDCFSIDINEVRVQTREHGIVQITRSAIWRLDMYRSRGPNLSSLGKGVRGGLKTGANLLFSPLAPFGVAMLPGTLVWGAVSAPFCVIGDVRAKIKGTEEIKVR